MIVQNHPPLHLTYCLNIHPGETWAENFAAIREKVTAVKQLVAPDAWFGLGLRIAHAAAEELTASRALRAEALAFFAEHRLYPFSINGFPYGRFHAGPVKQEVYAPDWRTRERLDYTLQLADILAEWMPAEVSGSISTVPCSFKLWIQNPEDVEALALNIGAAAAYLAALEADTGRELHLGLEPEPDCYLETTEETIKFYNEVLLQRGTYELSRIIGCSRAEAEALMRRHVGVCLDTCHVALQYEDLVESLRAYRAADIRISKVQLSAALQLAATPEGLEALQRFSEPVYLHQVKARGANGLRMAWEDLPGALAELPSQSALEELRVHFHVPLFFKGAGPLNSTASALTPDFFHELRGGACPHLEIETYTFDVLPPDVHPGDVVKSIAHEYTWTLDKLGT